MPPASEAKRPPASLDASFEGPAPLRAGSEWTADARFWLAQEPYALWHAPHTRAKRPTTVRFRSALSEWRLEFHCVAGPPEPPAAVRAYGDPDVWQSEHVQVVMPCGAPGECLHLSVTRAGQAISERFDKRLDPIPGWRGRAWEVEGGWRAEIVIPRSATGFPNTFRLARWTPDEGLTRWPTPFGSWWHVAPPDFLEIVEGRETPPPSEDDIEDFMRRRERDLLLSAGLFEPEDPKERHDLAKPPARKGEFLEAFQARAAVCPWSGFDQLPPANMEHARDMLEDRFWFHDVCIPMKAPFDWDRSGDEPFTMVHLARFDFLADLVAAWKATGDLAFARKAIECIETWLARHDLRQSLTPARYRCRWNWITIPHRLVCMMRTVGSLAGTGLLREELLFALYRTVAGVLCVLDGSLITRHYPKNHSLIMANHAVALSVLCGELRFAASLRERYFGHFRRALEVQFLPDGVQAELSTSYHMICYQRLTEATSLCEKAGVPVPPDLTEWRKRILTVGARYLTPHGRIFAFNDGGMPGQVDAIGRASDTFPSLILREGPALGANEALALASHGRQGALLPPFSHALPWAGHFMMRDGLGPEAIGLALDAGPFGMGHAHEDALTITLTAFGKTLLADLGSGAYDSTDPMRRYSISTAAHSTICVDGCGQASGWFPASWRRDSPLEGRHWFGRAVQFAAGEYGLGYGNLGGIKVEHRRAVLFVNGAWILVFDRLLGEGERLVESRFVFGSLPWKETKRGLQTTTGTGDLDVQAIWPGGLAREIACGREAPFAGWTIRNLHGRVPAPRLTFSERVRLPAFWVTLLAPFRDPVEIPEAMVERRDGEIRIRLVTPRSTDEVACREAPFEVSFANERVKFSAAAGADGKFRFHEEEL
ncbi:MAG: alginate lyase family protein [Verrucomicrobiae bacterium]|nr:alginate lyase family protein [Verrucomicrobiae bacterium]